MPGLQLFPRHDWSFARHVQSTACISALGNSDPPFALLVLYLDYSYDVYRATTKLESRGNLPVSAAVPYFSVSQVCDFGLAKSMETVASRVSAGGGGGSAVGTLAWKAPETFRGRYSEASDIFAMAGGLGGV